MKPRTSASSPRWARRQAGMNWKIQGGCYHGVRVNIVIFWFVVVVLIFSKCEALNFRDDLYDRVVSVCDVQLKAWANASSGAAEALSQAPAAGNESLSTKGVFMRGKWKLVAPVSGPIVHPSFLHGSEGSLDFFSKPDASRSMVQNISAQLVFRDHGKSSSHEALFRGTGFYNSHVGEVCLLVCSQTPSSSSSETEDVAGNTADFEEDGHNCSIRGLLSVLGGSRLGRINAAGRLESLRSVNESEYFTPISVKGSFVSDVDQRALLHVDIFVRSLIFVVEAAIVICQIVHSIRSPSGYFVSMLMILVQILVLFILAVRLIYLPLRLVWHHNFKYLITSLALLPYFIATSILVLNFLFFWVIFRKRQIAKRLNVEERPDELFLAAVCMVIYAIVGLVLWSLENFETYLQLVWCWFLLPQLIANVFWDLRAKPLHWFYVTGVSVCRITYLGFNALRPTIYGYDDLEDYPHGWFWGTSATMLLFASYALVQQWYGGRIFLPQRWFGYQEIPSSNAQVTQKELSIESVDEMFDL